MRNSSAHTAERAFTLIELILVMAVLVVTISLVTPTVAKFFDGRTLDSEVGRFVALTHYGQSRAVSEGVPMMLWIDPAKETYGLKQEPGYSDTNSDPKDVEYKVGNGLKIDVAKGTVVASSANSQTGRISNNQAGPMTGKLPAIHFLPEGTINHATSVKGVSIQESNKPAIWIGPAANRLSYEVQDQNTILANARH
ncbi:MAG TPA: prepilin-type N-terminal cleavage/methylation domain-containing protein [Verrucomicrobiae bacterium]|nr:prepilin-type N-terminal cleavage/methylation domain-containing protein [Verrucomicrobiae bacterium]